MGAIEPSIDDLVDRGKAVRHRGTRGPGDELHMILGQERAHRQVLNGDHLIKAADLDFPDGHALNDLVGAKAGGCGTGHGNADDDCCSGGAIH